MPKHDPFKDTTQIRVIQSVVQDELKVERGEILKAVQAVGDNIKETMHAHFATKEDLANWKLRMYQEQDGKARELIVDHVKKDHRASLMPKPHYTGKQKAGILAAALGASGVIIKGVFDIISYYFPR
jgi:hypothetical protein